MCTIPAWSPRSTEALADYYTFLQQAGFSSTWIRTDYRFESLAEAESLTRFFFGDELARTLEQQCAAVVENGWVILPECTGIWWLDVDETSRRKRRQDQ